MRAEIVSIGNELLLNDILDTNAAYTTRSLREMKVELTCKVTVGDERALIADALRAAIGRADLVITSGGLGRQSDDYTRQAISDVTGRHLIAAAPGVAGATRLGNVQADAYGILLEEADATLICLPGNPRDMTYLFETAVLPYLQKHLPSEGASGWMLLRTAGIMESSIQQQLSDLPLEKGQNLTYTSYAGQTDIRISAEAGTAEEMDIILEQLALAIRERLGDHVYGRNQERLEQLLLEQLRHRRLKVVIAEYETGQALANLMHSLPDTHRTVSFLPLTTHEGIAQYLGLDPLATADDLTRWCRLVAERLRAKTEADLALLVYNNVTQSGVQILVTLAANSGVSMMQRSFGGHPGNIDHWASTLGLVHLRRWLLAYYPENELEFM